ncbi:hypothetical protein OC846_004460 [Tilletia horrida]|uniref:Protein kinase domain-containing protein n=1 Tax=Tilletia horrida TaxID=155126 RepID=A0AAN6GN65_9BASI|nr:hypothetical protein OC846_004460 [Tilletia horrida]
MTATAPTSSSSAITTPVKSNKNDIFNAPSPILTPAPKLPSLFRPTPAHSPSAASPAVLPSLPTVVPPPPPSTPSLIQIGGKPPALRISTSSSSASSSSSNASNSFWNPPPLPILPPPRTRSEEQQQQPQLQVQQPGPSSERGQQLRESSSRPLSPLSGRARSPPLSNPDIRIRLILSGQYLLGIGSHSDVYLGSYSSTHFNNRRAYRGSAANLQPGSASRGKQHHHHHSRWQLCAIKRLHPDRESLLLGLDEVFVLRRLGPHPHVVRLIDVRDEVDLAPERGAGGTQLLSTSASTGGRRFVSVTIPSNQQRLRKAQPLSALARFSQNQLRSDQEEAELGSVSASASVAPIGLRVLKGSDASETENTEKDGSASHASTSARPSSTFLTAPSHHRGGHIGGHARSTSDTYGDRSPTPPRTPRLQNEVASSTTPDSSLTETNTGSDATAPEPKPKVLPINQPDPPRMLLLLELLPHQLSTYARLHPHRVTYAQWRTWALHLLSALVFFHARNLAHADIKKENCLLTDDLVLKVGDLGSARWMETSVGGNMDGAGLGTLAYSAPELARPGIVGGGGGGGSYAFGGRSGYVRREGDAGEGGSSFGVKVDIWSAGAVLYSLAIDQPPFSRARSTIDILQRKRNFFQTEEQDRTSRFDVEVGMNSLASGGSISPRPGSRAGSVGGARASASRHSSLRGRKGLERPTGGEAGSGSGGFSDRQHHVRASSDQVTGSVSTLCAPSAAPSATPSGAGSHTERPLKQLQQMSLLGLGAPSAPAPQHVPTGTFHSPLPSASSIPNSSANSMILPSSASTPSFRPRTRKESHRDRDSSADSVDSLASSIQNMDGRSPSALAVASLLADDVEEDEVEDEEGEGDDADAQEARSSGPSSAGLLSAGSSSEGRSSGIGGDSSPLRRGTAALLSHSQSRNSPSVLLEGTPILAAETAAAYISPSSGVRRTPSMPFRPVGGGQVYHYHGKAAREAGVLRHHSVKVHSPSTLGLGLGAQSSAHSIDQMDRHRVRATSVGSGSFAGDRAPAGSPAQTPAEVLMADDLHPPPTPIAEVGEGMEMDGAEDVASQGLSALGSFVPASPDSRGAQHQQQQQQQQARPSGAGEGSSSAHRKTLSVASFSSSVSSSVSPAPSERYHPHDDSEDEEYMRDVEDEAGEDDDDDDDDDQEDLRRYPDGAPPIILPGGGRLPDAARDLLRAMLETDPRRRPSAVEVYAALEKLPL